MRSKFWLDRLRAAVKFEQRRITQDDKQRHAMSRRASFEPLEERSLLAVIGDFNVNGVVDGSDYVLWRKTMNMPVAVPFAGADGNGNGRVDMDDYAIWRNKFRTGEQVGVAPPSITSNGGLANAFVSVVEHNTAVTTVQASGVGPITYAITGGVDRNNFVLNASTGVLSFKIAPDYDTPTDANADEEHVVEVTATNAGGSAVQTITVNVVNYFFDDTQVAPNQAALNAFKSYGTIGSAHFGIITYVPLAQKWEIGDGTEPLSIFDPGANFSWVDYLTKMKNIGCKAVMLTTKHVDGFCLWPSEITPDHNIAGTQWYANNGQRNLLAEFCNTARSMGMDVGFYFSLWDGFQLQKFGSYNGAYRTVMYGQLRELMTEFGDIKFIVLDAWGDFWGQFNAPTFGDMPRATVYNYVRSLQPNCLVGINDHEWVSGDFWIFEGAVDREPPPGITLKPVFWWAPMQATDYVWFSHSDSVVENVANDVAVNALRRDHMHQNGYVWGPNVSPGPSGTLSPDLAEILTELALPAGSGQDTGSAFAYSQSISDASPTGGVLQPSELRAIAENNTIDVPAAWTPYTSLKFSAASTDMLAKIASGLATEATQIPSARFSFGTFEALSNGGFGLVVQAAFVNAQPTLGLVQLKTNDENQNVPLHASDHYFESFADYEWSMPSGL